MASLLPYHNEPFRTEEEAKKMELGCTSAAAAAVAAVTSSSSSGDGAKMAAMGPPATSALGQLCGNLRSHFAQFGHADDERVKAMVSDYIDCHGDWRDYAIYHPAFYARNLVFGNEDFELIVICWKDGQKSPIHNHAGSSCWMGCLEGQIEETYYHVHDDETNEDRDVTEEGICPNLVKGQTEAHARGEVAYIRDEIALHVIRPIEGNAVSLHLYAPPIKQCLIYIPALGKTAKKTVSYYSVDKVPLADD